MIDYYSLIRRAVCALESNTRDERHALYERVRNALAGMLLASDPSPTETEIVGTGAPTVPSAPGAADAAVWAVESVGCAAIGVPVKL